MPRETELKPCPFCGGRANAINTITQGYAYCVDCKAKISFMNNKFGQKGMNNAIKAWNTRKDS